MLVLAAVAFALVVSFVLRFAGTEYESTYGGAWPVIQLVVLAVVHSAAGLASWAADCREWSDRLMWMMALHLHAVTYALNWPVYQGLVGTTELTRELLPNVAALFLILLPSLLMYGGPIAALLDGPRRREERRNEH